MEGDTLMFAQIMTVVMLSLAALVAIVLGARILWRMGSRVSKELPAAASDARLARLETAVEAVAIEVERISEAQRFTVTLLSERLPARAERMGELGATGGPRRVNTPH